MILPGNEMREMRQHSNAYIPYSFYECDIPHSFMNVPAHWHSEFEINYVVRGAGEFYCGGEKFTAGEGSLLVLAPNMLHCAYPCPKSGLLYYALVFSPSMLGAASQDRCTMNYIRPLMNGACRITPLVPENARNYPQLKACAGQIFACIKGFVPGPELLLKSELMRFFWLLETDEDIPKRKEAGAHGEESVRPVLEYMMKNYHENISVEQLAGIAHMSKSYFMNRFKRAVGISSIEYLCHLRINAACEALSSTDQMISEIAFGCGYDNLSNFNRQFKKNIGYSPNEYRRQSRRTGQSQSDLHMPAPSMVCNRPAIHPGGSPPLCNR